MGWLDHESSTAAGVVQFVLALAFQVQAMATRPSVDAPPLAAQMQLLATGTCALSAAAIALQGLRPRSTLLHAMSSYALLLQGTWRLQLGGCCSGLACPWPERYSDELMAYPLLVLFAAHVLANALLSLAVDHILAFVVARPSYEDAAGAPEVLAANKAWDGMRSPGCVQALGLSWV